MSGVIYFAEQVGGRLVKIGWTAGCPKRRVQSLQTGSPKKLRLLGTIPAESQEDEKRLHTQFADLRVHGEWFKRSKAILSLVPPAPKPEPKPEEKKPDVRDVLNQYLRDAIRYGVAQGNFTLAEIVTASGLPEALFDELVDKDLDEASFDPTPEQSRALFKALDRMKGTFPVRRATDFLACEFNRYLATGKGIKA
jgi:hypothetical protein